MDELTILEIMFWTSMAGLSVLLVKLAKIQKDSPEEKDPIAYQDV